MAVSSSTSCILSSCLMVLVFAGMQVYKSLLVSSQLMTIFGGYLGSILFILILTAVGNLESSLFGPNFQTKLFPEVILCLAIAMIASGMVHNVCITTCFIFSLVALFYINKISVNKYSHPLQAAPQASLKNRKNWRKLRR